MFCLLIYECTTLAVQYNFVLEIKYLCALIRPLSNMMAEPWELNLGSLFSANSFSSVGPLKDCHADTCTPLHPLSIGGYHEHGKA